MNDTEGTLSTMTATHGGHKVKLVAETVSLTEKMSFHLIIAFCIMANTGFVYIEQNINSESGSKNTAWLMIEIVFQVIFTFEAVLKIADKKLLYFKDTWN